MAGLKIWKNLPAKQHQERGEQKKKVGRRGF